MIDTLRSIGWRRPARPAAPQAFGLHVQTGEIVMIVMRSIVLGCLLTVWLRAQPERIVEDLEARARAALNDAPALVSRDELTQERERLRERIEESIGLPRVVHTSGAVARLYDPARPGVATPAIVLLRSHEEPGAEEANVLAGSLARLGFVVIDLDVRVHHDRLDLLMDGVCPQGLIQRDVRTAMAFLRSRREIDASRIGIVGPGLGTVVAAALNREFAAVAILGGIPDSEDWIVQIRKEQGNAVPDTCNLIPGFFRYGSMRTLLAAIAPRPLISLGANARVQDFTNEVYRLFGVSDRLCQGVEIGFGREARYLIYRWFGQWLQKGMIAEGFLEDSTVAQPIQIELSSGEVLSRPPKRPLTRAALSALLGDALPKPRMEIGLKAARAQETRISTQSGLDVPVTVFRPGPIGGSAADGALVAVDDRGRHALASDEIVQEAYRRQWVVYAIDPRGIGELKISGAGFLFAGSLLLGENFAWRQAWDVRRIIDFLAKPTVPQRSAFYARGVNASIIAAYVAAITAEGDGPEWVAIRDGIDSFASGKDLPYWSLPFNARGLFDISDLLAAARPKIIIVKDAAELLAAEW